MTRVIRQHVCTALMLVLFLGPAYAQFSTRDGLPDFYKVNENLYRGGRPTEAGLRNLAQLGVKTVIDLQVPGESGLKEKELVESLGMRYFAMPMDRGFGVDPEQIHATVKLLENPDYRPVYVHCRQGHDRTGVVVACFRIAHDGWTNQQAIREANAFKMNRLQMSKRRFILDYKKPPDKGAAETTAEVAAAKASQ